MLVDDLDIGKMRLDPPGQTGQDPIDLSGLVADDGACHDSVRVAVHPSDLGGGNIEGAMQTGQKRPKPAPLFLQ